MGIVVLGFLGFGLLMGGLIAFFNSEQKEAGIGCFVSGAILLVFPMVLNVSELTGMLVFLGSYFFLIPAWRAYKTYQEYKNRIVWGPLNKDETAARERAFNGLCIFLILFGLGAGIGLAMLFSDLAV